MLKEQDSFSGLREAEKLSDCTGKKDQNQYEKKVNWTRTQPVATVMTEKAENNMRKRKSMDVDLTRCNKENVDRDGIKRLK